MNERIRELRDQAWKLVSDEEQAAGNLYDAREQWERCDQKFAELIVEDCIFVMKSTVDESIDFHRKLDETSFWIESDIKKHFGVEE